MTCAQIDPGRWRLSFSEPEAAFLANIFARLAHHYRDEVEDMPPAVRAYWQGSISAAGAPPSGDLREAQEMLAEGRAELRSERLALAEGWLRGYETAPSHHPWEVELADEERDEFVAMLNDRRMTLALDLGISGADLETDPGQLAPDARRSAILEIDVLGHFILVALGPQIQRP